MNDSDGNPVRVGQQVKVLPHMDLFMRGVEFAEVTAVGRVWVRIYSGLFGRSFKIKPADILVTGQPEDFSD